MKTLRLLFSLLLFAGTAAAQSTTSFTTTLSAVSLPGSGGQTMAGSLAGLDLAVTPNFSLRQTTLVSSGAQTNGYFGGGAYTLAPLSKKLNNASPNLNGFDFQFQIDAGAGELRVSDAKGAVHTSWAGLFGGTVSYKIKGSNTWSLGVKIEDLFASSLPHKNNLLIALGPSIHF